MSTRTYTVDSRLPVPENVSKDDPSHPQNIVKNSLVIANQASADTKYDIYPPPRVEGFTDFKTLYFYIALLLIIATIITVVNVKNTILKIGAAIVLIFAIHTALKYL